MLKIYEFYWDCGRMGSLSGIFVADEDSVAKLFGKQIYFGEVLGKHSDIEGILYETDLTVKSEDPVFIAEFVKIFGTGTVSGYNPLDYYYEEEESDDEVLDEDEDGEE